MTHALRALMRIRPSTSAMILHANIPLTQDAASAAGFYCVTSGNPGWQLNFKNARVRSRHDVTNGYRRGRKQLSSPPTGQPAALGESRKRGVRRFIFLG